MECRLGCGECPVGIERELRALVHNHAALILLVNSGEVWYC
jgi:hypothetical protein